MGTGNLGMGGSLYDPEKKKKNEEKKKEITGALSFNPGHGTGNPEAPIDQSDSTETIIGRKLLDQAMSGIGGGSAATGAVGTAGLGGGGLTGILSSGAGAGAAGAAGGAGLMAGLGPLALMYGLYKGFS